MTPNIQSLTHYPIKGLSGQTLAEVALSPRNGFPDDRLFGFARPDSGFDPNDPQPLSKDNFHVLAMDAQLALLETHYDGAVLTITSGKKTHKFDLGDPSARKAAAQFIQDFLDVSDARPTLYSAAPHRFTDVSMKSAQMMNAVSLVNQASVDAFATDIGAPVTADRFRANIVFDGLPAWAELDLVGQVITVGEVQMQVLSRTRRCAATEVNLQTGERDLKLPYLLRKSYDHADMGIYAEVLTAGTLRPGDVVEI